MVNWPRVPWFGPQENDGGSRSRLRDFPGPVRVSSRPGDDFWDAEPEETPAPNPPAKTAGGDQSTAAPDQNPSPEFQYDQALAAEAPKRWCPEIDPNSADFAAILEDFGSMLADPSLTICDILEGTFAPHERALLLPTDRRQNPALYAIQKENRARYAELLDSERFGDEWKKTADLAFKLTLAYFGLPVAPLRADFSQQFPRFGDESDVEGEVLEAGDDDAPEGGRLRFLNCYKFRSYEHDVLRGMLWPKIGVICCW
ncbi:hypothetical protein B0T25DRAFT_282326 [Lasiosphaeria hispida]|uniref:Uncharacterized protein n=1 Tax=Lasiosphaeria hispida TaxID=260671 RepID=A0AAJ0MAZ7_9PEZI|nr:hypothetical protein B0T25DRAFT_282326 [Lasiosphaeria hispida]